MFMYVSSIHINIYIYIYLFIYLFIPHSYTRNHQGEPGRQVRGLPGELSARRGQSRGAGPGAAAATARSLVVAIWARPDGSK